MISSDEFADDFGFVPGSRDPNRFAYQCWLCPEVEEIF
jgi:hypothetical protein